MSLIDKDLGRIDNSEKLISSKESDDQKSDVIKSYVSKELQSFEVEEDSQKSDSGPKKNTFLGYFFMFIAVFGITWGHIFSKLAFTRNPELGGFDCITFFGIWLTIVYVSWSQLLGVSLNVTSLPKKPLIALILSIIVTLFTQLGLFKAISLIPVGKSTLIFSTNPIFSVILAFFILKEKLSKPIIFSALGAFVGIYFLSLNDQGEDEEKEGDLLVGIILVFICAWLQAMIFILVRVISKENIHFTVRPACVGVCFLGFVAVVNLYQPTFKYDLMDTILLSCVGLGSCMCIGPLSLAMQYEEASKLSPLLYTENIFTLLADAFLFTYTFVISDFIGIAIVAVCLGLPLIGGILGKRS